MRKSIVAGFAYVACFSQTLAAAPEGRDELALAARSVFQLRCAGCHGSAAAKPSGHFGYVLDLKRLAANPEMVVPGKPDQSELFRTIRTNEMPPRGQLTPQQKETVRAWILAGAPPVSADAEATATSTPVPSSADDVARILGDAGKFHLVLLHFPIAFLLAAAIGELVASGRKQTVPSAAVRFCLRSGSLTAVVTAALGWCYAAAGHGTGNALTWHRWVGTGAAGWALLTALVMERDCRRGKRESVGQLMVLIGAFLIGAAGYFGNSLIHGEIFTDW
jgi:mono/diheme cytochrome c family protein/uncharacterized membrane protein